MLQRISTLIAVGAVVLTMAGCGSGDTSANSTDGGKVADDGKITMGFSQVGAESGWRTANTKSVQESAKAAGIELKFSDAQQKQENQIKAIRSLHPAEGRRHRLLAGGRVGLGHGAEGGQGRQDPGDPDRPGGGLHGHDALQDLPRLRLRGGGQEGRSSGWWRSTRTPSDPVNIVELQGTTGSAPANDRKAGFAEVIAADPKFKIIASQTGDFTRAKGKEVMEAFLKANPDIDVLFAHNDDMGLGAIEAIEGAGKVPGKDIKIITDRRGEGRHAGPGRRQDQLHRRVQPAARPAADGPGQEGRGRRDRSRPAW